MSDPAPTLSERPDPELTLSDTKHSFLDGHRFGTDTDTNLHVLAVPDPDPYSHQNNADPHADFAQSLHV